MSDVVTLVLRAAVAGRLDVGGVTPNRLADLDEGGIARLTVWMDGTAACVGDVFDVRGGRATSLQFEGVSSRVDGLGRGMTHGRLLIAGDAGREVAAAMAGGSVEVRGSVGDDAGVGMTGGTLLVAADAGDRIGGAPPGASRGMTGGEIVVGGSAGREAALRCRRGLVVIGGAVGSDAGRAMIAGTLVVMGPTGPSAGRGNKRGSILAMGPIEVPDTYEYACTFEPPFVRLLCRYLHSRYGLALDERACTGRYRRYCGDRGYPGKGEILVSDRHSGVARARPRPPD